MLDAETRYYDRLLYEHLNGCGYAVEVNHEKLFDALRAFLLDPNNDYFLGNSYSYWTDVLCENCSPEMADFYCDLENTGQAPELYLANVLLPTVRKQLYRHFDNLYDTTPNLITDEMWDYASKEY